MAVELKSLGAWKRALEEGGMNDDGIKRPKPLSDVGFVIVALICFFLTLVTDSETPK
jgi:palmitoyltransferase